MTSALKITTAPASEQLVAAFLGGRNARTMRAYTQDLECFRVFVGAPDVNTMAGLLLRGGHGAANAVGLAYRSRMLEQGLAAATVNRRLAALRSLVKLGRVLGLVAWTLEVANAKATPYRDTRGPGKAGVLAMLAHLRRRTDAKGIRDRAILRLLYERALRCCEVVGLDLVDLDLERQSISILGKGRLQKEPVTLAPSTVAAVRAWLDVRGPQPGPLFVSLDRAHAGHRLTGSSVYDVVRGLGEAVGIRARPHGLRHAAITEALDRGSDVRAVQRFSRHSDLRILLVYDDNREDLGGQVARSISEPSP